MFRRLFWFTLGVVTGVACVSWVKRRAAEVREALTVETVTRMLGEFAVFAVKSAGSGIEGLVRSLSDSVKSNEAGAGIDNESRPAWRRNTPQPHNDHR